MKFIGTKNCPDCREAENVLKQANVRYEYVDISATTANLKMFLELRENRDEFVKPKQNGYIGIPCFLFEDDTILFDENKVITREEARLAALEEERLAAAI